MNLRSNIPDCVQIGHNLTQELINNICACDYNGFILLLF